MDEQNKFRDEPIDQESHSIQTHLSILQNIIQRMSENSSSSKTWCITISSAIIVVVIDKGNIDYLWISAFPIFVFFLLDSYYLALEINFRAHYNEMIVKLHDKKLKKSDLFLVKPNKISFKTQYNAIKSFSVYGFYLSMIFFIFIMTFLLK